MKIGHGHFVPHPSHVLSGTFTLVRTHEGVRFETSDNFYFDGSPDPGFALHQGEALDPNDVVLRDNMAITKFLSLPGREVEVRGTQKGLIPDDIPLNDYDTVVLWCFRFPFILGTGPITLSSDQSNFGQL